jgi:hypothetical protein
VSTPKPPAMVTLPRAVVQVLIWVNVANVLEHWAPLFAGPAYGMAVFYGVQYLVSSWRRGAHVARKMQDEDDGP